MRDSSSVGRGGTDVLELKMAIWSNRNGLLSQSKKSQDFFLTLYYYSIQSKVLVPGENAAKNEPKLYIPSSMNT